MRYALAALALLAATATHAQPTPATAEQVHESERLRFGFGPLRQGASGNAGDVNAANADEAKAGNLPLPPLFETLEQRTPAAWPARRAQLARLVEDNWAGRIPDVVQQFRIIWRKEAVPARHRAKAEHWIGQVITPDGRMGPQVDATITFPFAANPAPALIDYTYVWPGGRTPNFGGPPAPDSVRLALDNGFAHVAYRPQLLQADGAAQMAQGIIGLARWPREKTDWGALRAWAWGASQLRAELARDPRINAGRISLQGHSRFGKGVLVAAAFDHEFADANVSSAGAGGTKLMRRDFGERWENMAAAAAYHWFTPNVMAYASGGQTTADLPIDAHTLIALRAPRPLFITSGVAGKGDAWVDPTGMWLAKIAAQEAWVILGAPAASGPIPAAGTTGQSAFPLGWYQHTEGHIPWPGFDQFYTHEARFAGK